MLRLVLLTLFIFIPYIIAWDHDCGQTSTCYLNCLQENACDSVTINATLATKLSILCYAKSGCGDMTIYGNEVTINCNWDRSCWGSSITVWSTNPSVDFELNCNAYWACASVDIYASNYSSRYDFIAMFELDKMFV